GDEADLEVDGDVAGARVDGRCREGPRLTGTDPGLEERGDGRTAHVRRIGCRVGLHRILGEERGDGLWVAGVDRVHVLGDAGTQSVRGQHGDSSVQVARGSGQVTGSA